MDAAGSELERFAVLAQKDVVLRYAGCFREAGVGAQVRRLAMDGHEGLRLHDREDDLELLGPCMSRNMDARTALVVDVRADLRKRIDDARDGLLVAGDWRR